jgi:hypothetical protein
MDLVLDSGGKGAVLVQLGEIALNQRRQHCRALN